MERETSHLWKITLGQLVLMFALVSSAHASPLAANTGSILSLTAIGAEDPGDPIEVQASVEATSQIQRSNLSYLLYDPTGSLVTARKIDLSPMESEDIVNDGWTYANPPDTGNYTVTLCWSTGNAENCDIAYKETEFHSVPTLGWPLFLVAIALVVTFVVRRRVEFSGGTP